MTNVEESKVAAAKDGGVGSSQPEDKRRSSPMFASLQGYKRESNPEAFKARKESLSEATIKPESKLGAMWDNMVKGGNQAK
ncbi:hypothetical protein D0869_07983 [Hortaea werneckii]|uniref:Uncharacterized protein n=1 Tax=Hortaea werneckii TaxID=91943 RepID=A0A3M6YDI1_HORWE|nr:hypothetical protein KC324_g1153 [Hortaea werneckii]KAI7584671.1 hypothetical protein KC316_g6564 [Hortaea werneckii]RMX79877.1 hypothetical protein D0869_07983 [Hortaea werneckii]RMY01039.1 hypothetical protein D0868_08694 [Hortaea werneckii]